MSRYMAHRPAADWSWAGVVLDAVALLFIVGAIVAGMFVLAAGMQP